MSAEKSIANLGSHLKKSLEGGTYQPEIPISEILIKPQIRKKNLQDESLAELAASIKEKGLIQPITVRPLVGDDHYKYELIAGERRLRASIIAGKTLISAMVKHVSDREAADIQKAENVHREALDNYELFNAVSEDLKEYGTQAAVAAHWNKSEGWVSKVLAFGSLGPQTTQLIEQGVTGDRETLVAISRIEQKDPSAAAQVIEQIHVATKENDGTPNVRAIVRSAEKKRKAVKSVAGNAYDGKSDSNKSKSPEKKIDIKDILTGLFFLIQDKKSADMKTTLDTHQGEISSHLNDWWGKGKASKKSRSASSDILGYLTRSEFAADGAEVFAMVAFLEGCQGKDFSLQSVMDVVAASI